MNIAHRIVACCAWLACAPWSQGQTDPSFPVSEGLLAYYSFDDDDPGRDMTGNGWDGLAGGLRLVDGVVGKAAEFDGTGGFIVDAFRNFAWGSEFSVSLWFRRDDPGTGYQALINNTLDQDVSWSLVAGSENGGRAIWAQVETAKATRSPDFAPGLADPGKWHHLALIYTRGSSFFFVDGVAMLPLVPDEGPIRALDAPLQIACVMVKGQWRRSAIVLDEIRIYNRALASAEINVLASDTLSASAMPAELRPAIRRVSPNIRIGGAAVAPGRAPAQPSAAVDTAPAAAPQSSPAPAPAAGMTPATAPRAAAPVAAQQAAASPATWWTESQGSGVSSTTDCCVVYQMWLDLWRKGQKQAVIDDLNRLTGP